MPDWDSPTELSREYGVFTRLAFIHIGWYFWEFMTSLDFDWEYLTRKRPFKWQQTFYFLARYTFLSTMITLCIDLGVSGPVNCQALSGFMQITGYMSVAFSSIIFAIRTIAIWSNSRRIVLLLSVLILGQWSLIFRGVLLRSTWVPGKGCAISQTSGPELAAFFIYAMGFDFIVLSLATDGVLYFAFAFVGNLVVTIFQQLNLSPMMSVMFSTSSILISTVAATRSVRHIVGPLRASSGPEFLLGTPTPLKGLSVTPSFVARVGLANRTDIETGNSASDDSMTSDEQHQVQPQNHDEEKSIHQ